MGGRLPSCSRTLWFLSRDWDTSRTIRSRIQRDVHATKTYSIILPSALISSRQLIERRDERKRNPFVSRACTYPYFSFSLSLSRLLIHIPGLFASLANLSARWRPLVAAWKLLEARPSSKWTTISKASRSFVSFVTLFASIFHGTKKGKQNVLLEFLTNFILFFLSYYYFYCSCTSERLTFIKVKEQTNLQPILFIDYRDSMIIIVSFVRAEGRRAATSWTTPVLAASVASNVSCHWYAQRATWLYQSCDIIINNARYWSLTMHDRC